MVAWMNEEALRRNVAAHLREAGFTVDEAADGEEAIAAVEVAPGLVVRLAGEEDLPEPDILDIV